MRARVPAPGALVWLREREWRVEHTRVDRHVVRLDLAHHQGRLTVFAPFDRPVPIAPKQRLVTVRRQHARARLAGLLAATHGVRHVQCAVDAHMDLWPHQFEPAFAVLGGRRRVLIADEVGLGKTIQAGLILAELYRRQPSLHALLVVPAGLCDQWSSELRSRFGLEVRAAERDFILTASRSTAPGSNPWHAYSIWIASIDYIKQRHVMGGLPIAPWDVVVIDEAHIAAGRSDRHDACDELGRRARHLVLLSATPHSGDESRFTRLLRLGSLPLATDTIEVFRRTRADVSLPGGRVVRWHRVAPSSEVARLLDTLQQFERALLLSARAARFDAALLLLSVFRKRALSTMAALELSLARRVEWLDSLTGADAVEWAQPRLDFGSSDDMDDEERASLTAEVGMPVAQERAWLRRLRTLAAAARPSEPKIARLLALVSRTHEPVVVFTEFRHSLDYVRNILAARRSTATLHGGQTDTGRRHELARFLSGEASVLVATDVGGQGLNLQSRARWVVNLELPWNPARIEQRVGRVDRLGQSRRVHVTLLVTSHSTEDTLLTSLARRTLQARQSLADGTLADVAPPPHLAMAAALFARRALVEGSPAARTVALSQTHRRTARALTWLVDRHRRLRSLWRGRRTGSGRPVFVYGLPSPAPPATRGVCVFSVPILDRTGDIVERHLVSVTTTAPPRWLLASTEARKAAEAVAVRRLRARFARVERLVARRAGERILSERGIALHLHRLRQPGETQLGLFSQRAGVAFNQALALTATGDADASARLRIEDDHAHLEVGRPALVWVAERR